jgi:hypothetical protein
MADFNQSVAKSKTWDEFTEQLDYNEEHYLAWFVPGEAEPRKIKLKNIVFPGQPVTKVTELTDTPNTFLGQAGKMWVVKEDESGFEYRPVAEVTGVDQATFDALETRVQALEDNPSSYAPPAPYATKAALLADQANQIEHEEYTVEDASDWTGITSGWANFQKKVASTASESDYVLREYEGMASGGGAMVISAITPVTQTMLLATTHNNAILRVKDYTSIIIPTGLELKHRTVIKRATAKNVSLTPGENVVLETPPGEVARIVSQNSAFEIVLEEIDNGIEYWGVYGATEQADDNPVIVKIEDTSVTETTMMFPMTYKSSDFPELTTSKDYFMVYSTDHSTGGGAVFWAEMDDPEGSGFIEKGEIVSGYQCESPFLIRIPTAESGLTSETIFLYYHTFNEPGNAIDQETRLITTAGGAELHLCTFTDRGRPLGVSGTDNHTGYCKVFKRGVNDYLAHHSTSQNSGGKWGYSTSTDGLTFTRVSSDVSRTANMPAGTEMPVRTRIFPFTKNSTQYGFVWYQNTGAGYHDGFLGLFTLDTNYLPISFIKQVDDSSICDGGIMQILNDIAYLNTWEIGDTKATGVLKIYLGDLI